jgi:sulfatase maturation enzyme AslB (radical SAM superfamily)
MALWKTPQMAWNGELGVCCMDVGMALSLGNIKDKTLDEMWMGDRIKYWRLAHIRGEFEKVQGKKANGEIFSCADCPGIRYPPVTDQEIVDYLRITGDEQEIQPFLRRVRSPLLRESWLDSAWLKGHWWLTLELNATCNLRCPMCSQYVSEIHGQPMPYSTIKTLIDGFRHSGTSFFSFTPFYRGESTLHPEFVKIVDYITKTADDKLWKFITLHTNATVLDAEKRKALLDMYSKFERGELYFSIDAAKEATHQKLRKGSSLKIVKDNIIEFIKEKAKRKQEQPFMVFQFIVMDENVDEALDFYRFWKGVLEKYNQQFIVAKTYERILNVAEYEANIIYFRRKEGPNEGREHSLELQKRVFEELENEA